MECIHATDADTLQTIPVWDGWVDGDELARNVDDRTLTLRFASEPERDTRQLVSKRLGLSRQYRMPFGDWRIVVRNVTSVNPDDGWADMGMLMKLDYDEATRELVVESNGKLRIRVDRLDVQATLEGIRWMRRKMGVLGSYSDAPE